MAQVFISYKSEDKAAPDRLCAALENQSVACWIAPRDIPPGTEWPAAIVDAIGDQFPAAVAQVVQFVDKAPSTEPGYLPDAAASASSDNTKLRTDLNGDWLSLSQTGETTGPVRDTVLISARQDKPYLRRSVRPGALARGYLLLQISSQGQYLYGAYSGIHSDGHHMLLGWALGRDEERLKQAVETLRSSSALAFSTP